MFLMVTDYVKVTSSYSRIARISIRGYELINDTIWKLKFICYFKNIWLIEIT